MHTPKSLLGKTCGLLPIGIDSAMISTSGLEWNLGRSVPCCLKNILQTQRRRQHRDLLRYDGLDVESYYRGDRDRRNESSHYLDCRTSQVGRLRILLAQLVSGYKSRGGRRTCILHAVYLYHLASVNLLGPMSEQISELCSSLNSVQTPGKQVKTDVKDLLMASSLHLR